MWGIFVCNEYLQLIIVISQKYPVEIEECGTTYGFAGYNLINIQFK